MRATDDGFLQFEEEPLHLVEDTGQQRQVHVFQVEDVHAVNAALASVRPLLLRGKPGTGKSQLALAAAVGLGRAFVPQVIDARTESRDLLWTFDAVRRLADAQVGEEKLLQRRREQLGQAFDGDALAERFYISPGPLWWAFDWGGAAKQADLAGTGSPKLRAGCDPSRGVVVLLDEVDKADSSVPNGLLGALGDREFQVPGIGRVETRTETEPLVVLTTNEERSLPDAFKRRCAVHRLALDRDRAKLRAWFLRVGAAHFPVLEEWSEGQASGGILGQAADLVLEDREQCLAGDRHAPGCAEYLDLLRVIQVRSAKAAEAARVLEDASQFFLDKDGDEELA